MADIQRGRPLARRLPARTHRLPMRHRRRMPWVARRMACPRRQAALRRSGHTALRRLLVRCHRAMLRRHRQGSTTTPMSWSQVRSGKFELVKLRLPWPVSLVVQRFVPALPALQACALSPMLTQLCLLTVLCRRGLCAAA